MLAIETSQREASVALRDRRADGGCVIHEESLSPKKRHDDDLLPAIDRVFARAGLRSGDLRDGAVAVSIGPGGFTGLRIAIATAKMLAETLHVKLLAVPSALVAAESYEKDGPILVALACKNDTFWMTRLERDGDSWQIAGTPEIVRRDSFDFSDARIMLADEYFPDHARARLAAANIPIQPLRLKARACLAMGERMLERGEVTDPLRLLPLYSREPEAVTLWNARAARQQE